MYSPKIVNPILCDGRQRGSEYLETKMVNLVMIHRCVCKIVGFLAHSPCRKDERARDDEVEERVSPPPPAK